MKQSLLIVVLLMSVLASSRIGRTCAFAPLPPPPSHGSYHTAAAVSSSSTTLTKLNYGDAKGEYYGESSGSFMVKEFSLYEDLKEIVKLSSQALPERPDGIACVVKYTAATLPHCVQTEAEYERLARANPATVFLRCFQEYEDRTTDNAASSSSSSSLLCFGQANVQILPTYDIFYGGNRVARLEGGSAPELQEVLQKYQFQNSKLDLFSEGAPEPWGDGKRKDPNRTPRTTARFIPGYDWDKDKGFFDAKADEFQEEWDKIYGNWVPEVED